MDLRPDSPTITPPAAVNVNAPVFVPKAAGAVSPSPIRPVQSTAPTSSSPPPVLSYEHPTVAPDVDALAGQMQSLDSTFYEDPGLYQTEYDPDGFYGASQPTFTRQPLNYHLYSQPLPSSLSHTYFMSDSLREELQARSETLHTLPVPGQNLNLPDELQGYHSLVPLESVSTDRRKFGNWFSTVYRAMNANDGVTCILRRIESYRLPHQSAFSTIEAWARIRHPNIVYVREAFTSRAFGDSSLVVAYDYLPNAQTLFDAHLKPKPPQFQNGRLQAQSTFILERTIWSYIVQIASAIRAVHEAGQAVRMIDVTKILLTGKNRVRISSCGIVDVLMYDAHQDVTLLQQEDISMFGRLVFALCCNNVAAINSPQKALDTIGRAYSAELKNVAVYLTKPGPPKSIGQLFELIGGRVVAEMDEAQNAVDRIEGELMSELENGRLVRLLCKFGFINERPEFAHEPRWSETGDRYILKLFRDFVFHQVDEMGNPVVNFSHVLTCLNKLDAGADEKVMLVSRDEQSCLVVSYKEVKSCVDSAFGDLARSRR